mmetsp:Transcript_8197/g.23436  ORF Transcript_8197/g.23436 Transcript_8197/m.23436 type:complete len:227 (+) Transcript_8197:189-869(+)
MAPGGHAARGVIDDAGLHSHSGPLRRSSRLALEPEHLRQGGRRRVPRGLRELLHRCLVGLRAALLQTPARARRLSAWDLRRAVALGKFLRPQLLQEPHRLGAVLLRHDVAEERRQLVGHRRELVGEHVQHMLGAHGLLRQRRVLPPPLGARPVALRLHLVDDPVCGVAHEGLADAVQRGDGLAAERGLRGDGAPDPLHRGDRHRQRAQLRGESARLVLYARARPLR